MTKFKIGDKVQRKVKSIIPEIYGEMGVIYTIKEYDGFSFISEEGIRINCVDIYWKLAETYFPLYSEEAAVSLLKERGYKVEAPPDIQKGKVVIYKSIPTGKLYSTTLETWNTIPNKEFWTLIAIVGWTEGDGI